MHVTDAHNRAYWKDIVGQSSVVETLTRVAEPAGEAGLSHAWLITGPPGSGRSNVAYRFAAALLAREVEERELVYKQVLAGTHPDLEVLTTSGVIINIKQAREAAKRAFFAPSHGRYRVIVAEDADRLSEASSNAILKALEEPPERTIWILCAPSEADMLPTIRSRARSLRLQTPKASEVARLLVERDGVEPELAEKAARLAQSHIGMARGLAKLPEAMKRRSDIIELVFSAATLSDAMYAASSVIKLAEADAKALTQENDEQELKEAMRNMGVAPGESVPRRLRAQLKALEDDLKRRATRNMRDAVDRVLLDILTLFRDMILLSLGTDEGLVNEEFRAELLDWSQKLSATQTLKLVEATENARERLNFGITAGLVVEALFASIIYERER